MASTSATVVSILVPFLIVSALIPDVEAKKCSRFMDSTDSIKPVVDNPVPLTIVRPLAGTHAPLDYCKGFQDAEGIPYNSCVSVAFRLITVNCYNIDCPCCPIFSVLSRWCWNPCHGVLWHAKSLQSQLCRFRWPLQAMWLWAGCEWVDTIHLRKFLYISMSTIFSIVHSLYRRVTDNVSNTHMCRTQDTGHHFENNSENYFPVLKLRRGTDVWTCLLCRLLVLQ